MHAYGLERLFYKYGVDLEIWAHEHTYERMYPVYNRTVYNGSHGKFHYIYFFCLCVRLQNFEGLNFA